MNPFKEYLWLSIAIANDASVGIITMISIHLRQNKITDYT
jgi:hypothetical protein